MDEIVKEFLRQSVDVDLHRANKVSLKYDSTLLFMFKKL